MSEVLTLTKPETQDAHPDSSTSEGHRVILLNDDWHTFEDVIGQLILAINCSFKTAEGMALTVHNQGQCEVFVGGIEDCLEVSAILEDIDLKTEISFT